MNSEIMTIWNVLRVKNIFFILLVSPSYKFYSVGEDFDYQVRMEFIQMKEKLGEGGFGSVFLAYD